MAQFADRLLFQHFRSHAFLTGRVSAMPFLNFVSRKKFERYSSEPTLTPESVCLHSGPLGRGHSPQDASVEEANLVAAQARKIDRILALTRAPAGTCGVRDGGRTKHEHQHWRMFPVAMHFQQRTTILCGGSSIRDILPPHTTVRSGSSIRDMLIIFISTKFDIHFAPIFSTPPPIVASGHAALITAGGSVLDIGSGWGHLVHRARSVHGLGTRAVRWPGNHSRQPLQQYSFFKSHMI